MYQNGSIRKHQQTLVFPLKTHLFNLVFNFFHLFAPSCGTNWYYITAHAFLLHSVNVVMTFLTIFKHKNLQKRISSSPELKNKQNTQVYSHSPIIRAVGYCTWWHVKTPTSRRWRSAALFFCITSIFAGTVLHKFIRPPASVRFMPP